MNAATLRHRARAAAAFILLTACDAKPTGSSPQQAQAGSGGDDSRADADAKAGAAGNGALAPSAGANEELAKPEACKDWSSLEVASLPPLPESKFAGLLDQVWTRVLEKYYDPTIGCLDWPALRASYGAKLRDVGDPATAYDIINQLLGELKQSHFHLVGGSADAPEQHRRGTASPTVAFRWIENKLVAVADPRHELPLGSELIAIDDEAVAPLIERVQAKHPRPTELAFLLGRAVQGQLSCAQPGDKHRLKVLEFGSSEPTLHTVTCAAPKGELVTLGNIHDVPTQVEHRMIEGTKIGYIAFNIWMLPMLERVNTALADLRKQGCTALILDLRGNPGGVGAMAIPVARELLSEAGSLGRLRLRGSVQEFNVAAGADPFTGPVALLVDEGTASTSEIFATGLRDLHRVKVVGGGPSAGAALPSVIDELEGGAVLQYVVGDYESPKGTVAEGIGVIPDVLVQETQADFAAGRDAVLLAAEAALQEASAPPTKGH